MSNEKRFVICVENEDYQGDLVLRKAYQALEDPWAAEHAMVRVIDESGEDYLYPSKWFVPVELPEGAAEMLATLFEREHATPA